jgi:hypothetical protein
MKVTVSGIEKIIPDLVKLTPAIEKAVILRMSQVAYDAMQQGAGRHRGETGVLFQSVYNRTLGNHAREVGHDTQRAPYAPFVIFGTRPHKIFPKTKKLLRWASNGRWYSKYEVNHTGYVGDDYLNRSADEAIRQFRAIVDAATKEQS